jgi:hypothetical protein
LVETNTPPIPQIRVKAVANVSPLLAAIVVFATSNGCPNVVTSNIFKPAPSNRLLNLTGFFSGMACATDIFAFFLNSRDPDQGIEVASSQRSG